MSADEPQAFEGQVSVERVETSGAPCAGVPTVKAVHYPGAQQIVLWLPRSIYEDDGYQDVVLLRDGAEVWREAVRSRINGSVQMLFDTLTWPPGGYLVAITHRDGWRHEVGLIKHDADWRPPPPPAPAPEPPRAEPDVWRDGAGKVIPQVDLQIRAELEANIARRFGRRLSYEGTYRSGTIIYDDGKHIIHFDHEMCGGDLKFTICVPTREHWEASTGTPLSERDEIVEWVAGQVRRDQAPSWKYRITPDSIDFY
jgi:hypothetical protein